MKFLFLDFGNLFNCKKIITVLLITTFLTHCSNYKQHQWRKMAYQERAEFHHALVWGPVVIPSDKITNPSQVQPKYQYNATQYFNPASCQKIITGLLAYKVLGPQFRYITSLKLVKDKKDNAIKDIIISFSGDPTFTSVDLAELLAPLKGKNIKGKIIIDHSAFQTPEWSPGWMINDIGSEYVSPVSAAIIDRNSLTLQIYPTSQLKPAKAVILDGYKNYKAQIITSVDDKTKIDFLWQDSPEINGTIKSTLQMEGVISAKELPLTKNIAYSNSKIAVLHKLKQVMKQLKIKANYKSVHFVKDVNKLPTKATLVRTHYSAPLLEFLAPAMKKSDNLVFDSLYLTILNIYKPGEKRWEEGSALVKELVYKLWAVDLTNSSLIDGSGLSRYNLIQPLQLWMILQRGFVDTPLIAFLARPGEVSSTLEKQQKFLPPFIYAKTGSLTGVRCLCGYSLSVSPSLSLPQEPLTGNQVLKGRLESQVNVFVEMFSNFNATSMPLIYNNQGALIPSY